MNCPYIFPNAILFAYFIAHETMNALVVHSKRHFPTKDYMDLSPLETSVWSPSGKNYIIVKFFMFIRLICVCGLYYFAWKFHGIMYAAALFFAGLIMGTLIAGYFHAKNKLKNYGDEGIWVFLGFPMLGFTLGSSYSVLFQLPLTQGLLAMIIPTLIGAALICKILIDNHISKSAIR